MTVLLVLYPTVMILGLLLSPRLASLPFPLQMFVGNAVSVAILTWLLMPVALRAFASWLTPAGTGVGPVGLATVLVGYAVAIAVFFAFG